MRHNRWEANLWFTICRIVYCEHHCILGDYPFVWWANLCVTAGGYMCQMTRSARPLGPNLPPWQSEPPRMPHVYPRYTCACYGCWYGEPEGVGGSKRYTITSLIGSNKAGYF